MGGGSAGLHVACFTEPLLNLIMFPWLLCNFSSFSYTVSTVSTFNFDFSGTGLYFCRCSNKAALKFFGGLSWFRTADPLRHTVFFNSCLGKKLELTGSDDMLMKVMSHSVIYFIYKPQKNLLNKNLVYHSPSLRHAPRLEIICLTKSLIHHQFLWFFIHSGSDGDGSGTDPTPEPGSDQLIQKNRILQRYGSAFPLNVHVPDVSEHITNTNKHTHMRN